MRDHPWFRHYPPGVLRELPSARGPLWGLLRDTARRRPDAPAVVFEGRTLGYGAMWRAALAAAARLGDGGGRTMILALPNRPEFVAGYYGALRAGWVVTAANPLLAPAEVESIVRDVRPALVAAAPELAARYRDALRASDEGRARVVVMEDVEAEAAAPGDDREDARGFDAGAVAVLQHTSGTTGGLKAAMMTHANLTANALQNNLWFGWSADDMVLGALPLCHTWGMCCALNAPVAAGAAIVLVDPHDAAGVLAAIRRHRVTVAYGSATFFSRLLDAAGDGAAECFASLRYVKAGAMLVGGTLVERWQRAVPDVPMILGYGLTEASPEVADNPLHRPKPGTVGLPLPGTEVRIADPEHPEAVLADDAEGEIQVRGPQVMAGYHERPEETARTLLPGGWLRTGDLGALDDEGYLRVVDRLKDLIKFRGWSVVPAQVERALITHPAVAEAIVVGAPHPVDGEVPVAFIRAAHAPRPETSELDAHLEPLLAPYEKPRAYRFVDEIPKNAVGKPLRRLLRARAARPEV